MAYKNPIPSLTVEADVIVDDYGDYIVEDKMYFVFIDILGFKKTFDDYKLSKDIESIKKYKEVFNYYFALMNNAKFMKNKSEACYAGQTSDSLYFYTKRVDYLMDFIKIFVHFNMYSMSKNVFFRGGISQGMLYRKQDYQFFGDSVIGAYLMESNISRNPVITIDQKTHFDLLESNSEYKSWFYEYDGRFFVKVFGDNNIDVDNVVAEVMDDFVIRSFDKKEIMKNIEENILAFEYDVHNYSKYIFLKKEIDKIG